MGNPAGEWSIERLKQHHQRSAFDCSVASLNDWLRHLASQYERRDLARTYVLTRTGDVNVLGFYALSSHGVNYGTLPDDQTKGLPRIDVPVILLGRLAVDRHAHGQGLGSLLLMHAFRRVLDLPDQLGVRAIEVDAIDESAKQFYEKHGFRPLLDHSRHLFLPLQVIRKLNLPPS